MDSEFLVSFKRLKQLRNSHQIDEPDFDEQVEQLAANTYAHPTRDGWCCACDADIAFANSSIQKEPEFKQLIAASNKALLLRVREGMPEPMGEGLQPMYSKGYNAAIDSMLYKLKAEDENL